MVHAIFDQLRKCSHPILKNTANSHDLRLYICSQLHLQLDDNLIFWVSNISPKVWLKKMKVDGTWCDDVFLQLAANIFSKNIFLIPLSASSAHHGGMYSDLRSVDGGSGDPFFMLYFEEWRTAGHYQSLEVDPNVDMNRVLAHFSWRTKCLSRSGSTLLSGSASLSRLPSPSSTVEAELSSPLPTASSSALPSASSSCPPVSEQLTSTRQRIELEVGITFCESPIARPARVDSSDTNQGTDLINYTCNIIIIILKHFRCYNSAIYLVWQVWL